MEQVQFLMTNVAHQNELIVHITAPTDPVKLDALHFELLALQLGQFFLHFLVYLNGLMALLLGGRDQPPRICIFFIQVLPLLRLLFDLHARLPRTLSDPELIEERLAGLLRYIVLV